MAEIPVFRPKLPEPMEIAKFLELSHTSRHYSNWGPALQLYEQQLADYFGAPRDNVVVLSNATLCLQGLIAISTREEWVIPDFTFAATGLAVLNAKKRLQLADVNLDTWALDGNEIEEALKKGNGVAPVLPFGADFRESGLEQVSGLVVDAAASIGSAANVFKSLDRDSSIVFSLHATKVMPAGEGGVALCGSEETAVALKSWATFGFDQDRISAVRGTNGKMSEACAAVGLASLNGRDEEFSEWAIKKSRIREISTKFGLMNPTLLSEVTPYWIVALRDADESEALALTLGKSGVGFRRWWPKALSQMPVFRYSHSLSPEANSVQLAKRLIGLPYFREITEIELDKIESVLGGFFGAK